MTAAVLLSNLRDAGLTVHEFSSWMTRGGSWEFDKPIGIMEHHTAPPVPYPVSNLAGVLDGNIKCNMNVKPDGTIWMVAYEACNFSSGGGMRQVRNEVLAGTPPTKNARDRGWSSDGSDDDDNGNDLFWNFENDHAGNGTAMPAIQTAAIITASAVVADYWGFDWRQVISHAEWTARKGDPNWDGSDRVIESLRDGMEIVMSFTAAEIATLKDVAATFSAADIDRLNQIATLLSADEALKLNAAAAEMVENALSGHQAITRNFQFFEELRTQAGIPNAAPDKLADHILTKVKGPKGDPGADGEDGEDGADGSLPPSAPISGTITFG